MKTPALSEALSPIRFMAAQATAEHKKAQEELEAEEAVYDARRRELLSKLAKAEKAGGTGNDEIKRQLKALSATERDMQKKERRFITSDATIEKLGELLIENPRGVLVVRDELTGFLRGLERDDHAQDRAFYLEAWNGKGSFTVDRIGRGTLHVPALCLSIAGGIQPGRLRSYIEGAIAQREQADGLLQRFQLLVWPDETGEWRHVDRWPDKEAKRRALSVFQCAAALDPFSIGAQPLEEFSDVPNLRFADDAQELFLAWWGDLEREIRSPELQATPAYCEHLSKFRGLFPKLALLFHLVDVADQKATGPVSLSAARLAASWTDFLRAHARKVYADELAEGLAGAHALARKLHAGAVKDGATVRSIAERDWSGLGSAGTVHAAAETLERLGWLRLDTLETGGRPSTVIRLNPRLIKEPAR